MYRQTTDHDFCPGKITMTGAKEGSVHRTKVKPTAGNTTATKSGLVHKPRRMTKKAICTADCCSFSMWVFLEKSGKGWFLSVYPSTVKPDMIGMHWGHRKMMKTSIKTSVRRLDDHVLKLAGSCRQIGLSATESSLLIQEEKSINLDSKQTAYLKLRERVNTKDMNIDRLTAAERMVKFFDERSDISYVMVLHEDHKLLVVTKRWGSKKTENMAHEQLEQDIRDEMLITLPCKRKKTLVLFAWVTDEELRLARMFGQVMTFDCTAQTNKQKRDLFTATMKDGNNKLNTCMRAFLGNQKLYTFHLLFQHMSLSLWGVDICNRVTFICTDGDRDEIVAAKSAIAVSG